MPNQQYHAKVLIAGGSIAGLTLANALEQAGVDYLVLEKYKHIAPDVGASICIFPNGFKILDQLGCYERIKELASDADSFRSVTMRNMCGKAIIEVPEASRQIEKRMGYAPIFLERRMLIQALYDNLNDKSKVHIGTGVSSVNLTSDGVQATARNGDQYFGQILIGADGIHSTVRSEMWRLADEQQPSLFVLGEQKSALVTYCCMFGISNPKDGFPKFQTQHIQGKNHSYLLSTGPGNDVYWFLFERLAVPAYGLHDKIPRYTDAEKDALAEEHVGDQLSDALTFGNLYQARRAATLQALPEVVFSRWHYGRIMTIGDAAHKLNPIGGQGGNSAIEDAACLANQLYRLVLSEQVDGKQTEAAINAAFAKTQELRHARVKALLRKSHYMQRVQAMDSWVMGMVAKYVMPLMAGKRILSSLCNDARGGVVLEFLPRSAKAQVDRQRASKIPWVKILAYGILVSLICNVLKGALLFNKA